MINIVGTIYDNSSLHTVALADQVLDEEYQGGKKQSEINQLTDENIAALSTRIKNIEDFLNAEDPQSEGMSVQEVLALYNEIKQFIESLDPDDDRLLQIINSINAIDAKIDAEELRAKGEERQLNTRAQNIENRLSAIERNGSGQGGDGTNHVILTQSEYNELSEYTDNTIYFIIEPESNTWTFGGTFPIRFGTTFTFGGTFPITLT